MAARAHDLDDDAALVVAVQAGDTAAYAELFRRHYATVRRVCARRLGNLVDADEIAQAAFVRAYERIDRCGGERRFGAWVQVIAHRLCIDHVRACARTMPDEEPVKRDEAIASNGPEEALLQAERTAKLHEALALLPDRQREVVVARHLEGRRPPEIAAALGLSVGAVDSLLLRARRRLAASYQSVLTDAGAAALQTTVATAALGTVAAGNPGRLSRAWGAVNQAVADLSTRAATAVGATSGSPGAGRTAAVALAAAGATLVGPAAPQGPVPVGTPQLPALPSAPVDGPEVPPISPPVDRLAPSVPPLSRVPAVEVPAVAPLPGPVPAGASAPVAPPVHATAPAGPSRTSVDAEPVPPAPGLDAVVAGAVSAVTGTVATVVRSLTEVDGGAP